MSELTRSVRLGVLAAPGLPEEVTARIADDLAEDLRKAYGALGWLTEFVVDRLALPPAPTTELIDAARRALLERGWDLAVVVTDLPLRLGRRPVSRHVSRTHGVALVSLPALGLLHLKQRLRQALSETAGELIGEAGSLREITAEADDHVSGLLYAPTVVFGHLRLTAGMVRANRPWRFAAKLYGVLAAALAAGAYAIVASDIWRISAALGWWRLAAVCLVSLTVTIVSVIVAHELWEHARDPRVRAQVLLFNVATALTVTIGIASLYAALLILIFAGEALVLTGPVLAQRSAATPRRATTSPSPGSQPPSAPSPAHSAPHSNRMQRSAKPPTRVPRCGRTWISRRNSGYLPPVPRTRDGARFRREHGRSLGSSRKDPAREDVFFAGEGVRRGRAAVGAP